MISNILEAEAEELLRLGFQGELGNLVKKPSTEKSGRRKGKGRKKRQEGSTLRRSVNPYCTDEVQHLKFKSVV